MKLVLTPSQWLEYPNERKFLVNDKEKFIVTRTGRIIPCVVVGIDKLKNTK